MFDIGLGEIIALAVIALIVFGPDRLPKAAAQGGKALRQLREMAANARKELGDSAGLDTITEEIRSLQELHPKRIIASAIDGSADEQQKKSGASETAQSSTASSPGGSTPNASGNEASSSGQAASQSTPKPAPGFDPDAT